MRPRTLASVVALLACALVTGCGTPGDAPAAGPTTRRVPADYPTIQAAVDASGPGDLVLISPGEYEESVAVETEDLVLRGVDRNTVVLRGDGKMENGIFVLSDGVAVENLTVRGYRSNGVMFSGAYDGEAALSGFRVSHVTVHDNGLYGVYAFTAQGGVIDHVYASGHPDGGVYVGQCQPCDTVVTDLVAENNAVGYLGTNSGGNLFVVDSIFRSNRVGVQPNSSRKEEFAPGRGTTIAGNLIEDNANPKTPKATAGFGVGIGIGGAEATLITKNRIRGNPTAGVVVADNEVFSARDTRVEGNVLEDNGVDLLVASPNAERLCFAHNSFTSSAPASIETAWPCAADTAGTGPGGSAPMPAVDAPPGADRSTFAEPPPQPSLPDATTAPGEPASDSPRFPDVAAVKVPAG